MLFIVGNWKMYKTAREAQAFIDALSPFSPQAKVKAWLAVPFTDLATAAEAAAGKHLEIGSQNIHDAEEGAFTGEISARMVREAGGSFVILGHSERRHLLGETNPFIARKVKRAFASGLKPILCIGETEQERERGETEAVLLRQLIECLPEHHHPDLMIAYEPVWAIGTGKSATPEMAEAVHAFCRRVLAKKWGQEVAARTPLLYGGSVKPDNIKSLTDQPNIDGALVGGASLDPKTFMDIIRNTGMTL
jgi:triosephosphate isomerase